MSFEIPRITGMRVNSWDYQKNTPSSYQIYYSNGNQENVYVDTSSISTSYKDSLVPRIEFDNDLDIPHTTTYTCSVCKENFSDKSMFMDYSYSKFNRKICKHCAIKALDKMFGVQLDAEQEKLLYGK